MKLIPEGNFGLMANIHDEEQMEVRPDLAETAGRLYAESIKRAGEALSVRCPLAGAFDIGNNWADCH